MVLQETAVLLGEEVNVSMVMLVLMFDVDTDAVCVVEAAEGSRCDGLSGVGFRLSSIHTLAAPHDSAA